MNTEDTTMGWLFYSPSKKRLVNDLISDSASTTIKHSVQGNVLWSVCERTDGFRFIRCDLLAKEDGRWGYKAMTESEAPCYYSCPLRFLELVPEAPNDYAVKWRKKVRLHHLQLRVGQILKLSLPSLKDAKIIDVTGRTLIVRDIVDNKLWKLPPRYRTYITAVDGIWI